MSGAVVGLLVRGRAVRVVVWLLVGLAVVGASSGCWGGSARQTPSTPSIVVTSPTGSGSTGPSVAVPVLPPAARAHDAVGAQEFARYWFEVVNYTFVTRDTAEIRRLAVPTCVFCRNLADKVDGRRNRGETYVGGSFGVNEAVSPGLDGSGLAVVDVSIRVTPSKILNASGVSIETDPGTPHLLTNVTLRPTALGWEVEAVVAKG